jgi:hypothetical protein
MPLIGPSFAFFTEMLPLRKHLCAVFAIWQDAKAFVHEGWLFIIDVRFRGDTLRIHLKAPSHTKGLSKKQKLSKREHIYYKLFVFICQWFIFVYKLI